MEDRLSLRLVAESRSYLIDRRQACVSCFSSWGGSGQLQPVAELDPNLGRRGAGAFSQKVRHPRQQHVSLFGAADARSEVREDVIGTSPVAVDGGIGNCLEARSNGKQQRGHQRDRYDGG